MCSINIFEVALKMMRLHFMSIIMYLLCCNANAKLDSNNKGKNDVRQNNKLYKDIKNKIELIKKECGSLCDIDPSTYKPIPDNSKFYYVPIKKEVDCQSLWNNSIFDEKGLFKEAPQTIPKYLRGYFTHNSSLVDIKRFYFDEINDNIWNDTFNNWGRYINTVIHIFFLNIPIFTLYIIST